MLQILSLLPTLSQWIRVGSRKRVFVFVFKKSLSEDVTGYCTATGSGQTIFRTVLEHKFFLSRIDLSKTFGRLLQLSLDSTIVLNRNNRIAISLQLLKYN
jgi:hypothetical protein